MKSRISNAFYEGNRACFWVEDTQFDEVRFYPGEAALMHCKNIEAIHCEFLGHFSLWNTSRIEITHCHFTRYACSGIWYAYDVKVEDCIFNAPGMFRRVKVLIIKNSSFTDARECLWDCNNVKLTNVDVVHGDYILMRSESIDIREAQLQGDHAFYGSRNIIITSTYLDSASALWNAENVTIYDSVLEGDCLGWHSRNIRLVNCTLRGRQPFCYASEIRLEKCIMEDAEDCFENSSIDADLQGHVISIKNPRQGRIRADSIESVIIDEYCLSPESCRITVNEFPEMSAHDFISRF